VGQPRLPNGLTARTEMHFNGSIASRTTVTPIVHGNLCLFRTHRVQANSGGVSTRVTTIHRVGGLGVLDENDRQTPVRTSITGYGRSQREYGRLSSVHSYAHNVGGLRGCIANCRLGPLKVRGKRGCPLDIAIRGKRLLPRTDGGPLFITPSHKDHHRSAVVQPTGPLNHPTSR
jgi:hypothetical protein